MQQYTEAVGLILFIIANIYMLIKIDFLSRDNKLLKSVVKEIDPVKFCEKEQELNKELQ